MNLFKKTWRHAPVISKLIKSVQSHTNRTKSNAVVVFNSTLILFQVGFIALRIKYVNEFVPLWFTQSWGDAMLDHKKFLYLLPTLGLAILLTGALFEFLFRKYFVRYLNEVILMLFTLANVLLT